MATVTIVGVHGEDGVRYHGCRSSVGLIEGVEYDTVIEAWPRVLSEHGFVTPLEAFKHAKEPHDYPHVLLVEIYPATQEVRT